MVNSVSNNKIPTSYAGVNINCYTLDPTKLPPDSPLLHAPQPQCTIAPAGFPAGGCCYPGNYYINNYAPNGGVPNYPIQPNVNPQQSQNTKKKRVQVLTDQYIKNLEAYLDSDNEELREYAASEVLQRLQEDKTRYNDKALNVLVNKMIIDPFDHKVRDRGLLAIESQLAGGDENTKNILLMLQQDPNLGDMTKGSIANSLLQLSAKTTMVNQPIVPNTGSTIS